MILEDTVKFERESWMSILAKAHFPTLEKLWSAVQSNYSSKVLRKPETGLLMVRGRIGGSGAPFNTGEATITRCSVTNEDGHIGHAYILGRNHEHAKIAAEIDAALQNISSQLELFEKIIEPLKRSSEDQRRKKRAKVAATKVDFFTVVRGED